MSLTTVNPPTVEVERVDVRKATALILADSIRLDLPYPHEFRRNGRGSDLLCLDFDRISDVIAWAGRFEVEAAPYFNDKSGMDHVTIYVRNWHGWCLAMSACEDCGHGLAPIDPETVALIDEVTAEPGCTCAGSFHANTCPAKPNMAEWLGPIAADPPMLCIRCGEPLQPGQPFHQRTAGRVHVGCKLTAGIGCVDCGGLGGSHQESCAFASRVEPCRLRVAHEPHGRCLGTAPEYPSEPVLSSAEAASRVDVDAAAQIEVVVVDIPDGLADRLTDNRITAADVAQHLGDDWLILNNAQRVRLVELCGLTGWMGDWRSCLANVRADDALRSAADDARVAVSELDDIADVSLEQLAATVGVDPHATIDLLPAHAQTDEADQVLTDEQRHCHTIDVTIVDRELVDDGRGNAEMDRTVRNAS